MALTRSGDASFITAFTTAGFAPHNIRNTAAFLPRRLDIVQKKTIFERRRLDVLAEKDWSSVEDGPVFPVEGPVTNNREERM